MPLFNNIMGLSDTYMPLLALIAYLVLWRKISKKEQIVFFYLVVNVALFATTNVLVYYKMYNLFLYHSYALFELWIVTWYFTQLLLKKKIAAFFIIGIVYTFFWIINILFWEPLTVFNSNSAGFANLIILLLSMYYMFQLSKSDDILNFQKLPAFWFASAFLTSCAISVLGVVVYKYYQFNLSSQQMETGLKIWLLQVAGNIIKFILIIFGLICYKRKPSSSTSLYSFP